ncbi:replication-associated recombination protein A [Neptunomonas phycophila]|uniref:Replication-associated recombination protein A n=1 Tax=Neptunomonas phycophila TaxID=1572645 RepID=A0ABT9EQM1_9GAMM|nr:replication-associated recombination protein A [Neptunomonas phycophila]MDO6466999.1 replication-associated recombination protein A [Neptunomonas phycophila]MDP2521360.1 replication-associated recombination protein A [Neptunomonas phycophila]
MDDLFGAPSPVYQPLAAKMRPTTLANYIGQSHLLGEGKPLRAAIEQGMLHSMILWGPPGVGKTTLAKIVANTCDAHFMTISAVLSGVKDIRAAVDEAKQIAVSHQQKVILFVDEVHRFNKSQQDAFLPYIEDGTFLFIGATTENPSFELNNALLSRARVYLLKNLTTEETQAVINQALKDEAQGLGQRPLTFEEGALAQLALAADGDARRALNLLEIAADFAEKQEDGSEAIRLSALSQVLAGNVRRYDKRGDLFYDMISAFHKSVRGSSPDGALYWCCRMLEGGCDPLYIARRLVAIASEDIGNADPRAMQVALSAWDAFERVGPAEGERAIAQAAVYCASAPKSNALYMAYNQCRSDVRQDPDFEVPVHLRNAPTSLMKDLGYGAEYRYAHNEPNAYAAGEVYLPEEIAQRRYYQPSDRGLESKIRAKFEKLNELDQASPQKRYT